MWPQIYATATLNTVNYSLATSLMWLQFLGKSGGLELIEGSYCTRYKGGTIRG